MRKNVGTPDWICENASDAPLDGIAAEGQALVDENDRTDLVDVRM